MRRFLRNWIAPPFEALYLALHHRNFQKRSARQKTFAGLYVVSVGNLSAGGTGKTPMTMLLAGHLRQAQVPAIAVLRGYGGSVARSGGTLLVSDGSAGPLATPEQCGDEALLLARTPGLRVAVGRDRAAVLEQHAGPARVVLLDDAFQNPSVARNHELVLLDALVPPEAMRVFPAGIFREPPAALARAHTIVLTRADLADAQELLRLESFVAKHAPGVPIFRGRHRPGAIVVPAHNNTVADLSETSRPQLAAFCGLGNPAAFFATAERALMAAGRTLSDERRVFADHHPYTRRDIESMLASAPQASWLTSAKDYVKLAAIKDLPEQFLQRILVLEIHFEVLEGRGDEFIARVLPDSLIR